MLSLAYRLLRRWRQFWREPDTPILDQGGEGELMISRVRFMVIGALVAGPFARVWFGDATLAVRMAVGSGVGALLLAVVVYIFVRRNLYVATVGLLASALDVTLVSAALVAFLSIGRPDLASESSVLFGAYLIAIGATALRYDPRGCVLTGIAALLQYGPILGVAYAAGSGPSGDAWWTLLGRLGLIGGMTIVATLTVGRVRRLRLRSAKDPLTGLLTRGFFQEMIGTELNRTIRYRRQLSFALIDVDHFKTFNDSFGHTVGDEVLRLIAKMLASGRQSDLVGRYGGEEFIIAFPETDSHGAVYRAEQLRKIIEPSSVTVSIGVATVPDDGEDLEVVIDLADKRLYEAKEGGRNRVVGPPGVPVPELAALIPD